MALEDRCGCRFLVTLGVCRHLDGLEQWSVTPLVLHPKQTTKSCQEHHVYVIMYVMECVDNIFVTLDDQ